MTILSSSCAWTKSKILRMTGNMPNSRFEKSRFGDWKNMSKYWTQTEDLEQTSSDAEKRQRRRVKHVKTSQKHQSLATEWLKNVSVGHANRGEVGPPKVNWNKRCPMETRLAPLLRYQKLSNCYVLLVIIRGLRKKLSSLEVCTTRRNRGENLAACPNQNVPEQWLRPLRRWHVTKRIRPIC